MVSAPAPQSSAPAPTRFSRSAFGPMLITSLTASVVVLIGCAAVAWGFGPPDAVKGAVAGVLLAAQFFAFGAIGLRLLMNGPSGGMLFGALAVYAIQVTALLYALMLIPAGAVPAPRWFAVSAAVETVVWQIAQSVALFRARVPVFALEGERAQ